MRATLLLGAAISLCATMSAYAADLEVIIADVGQPDGQLMLQILQSKAAFDGKAPPTAAVILPAGEKELRFATNALAPGRYAARVVHDRNGNGALDSNLLGMPSEPWGFSNDATGSFGPPSFDAAALDLPEGGTSITLHLNH
jgi:uncharacterized protein (DUF2141 family)